MPTLLEIIAREAVKEAARAAAKANIEKLFKDIQDRCQQKEYQETSEDESFFDIEAARKDFEEYSDGFNILQLRQLGKTTAELWVEESMAYDNIRINEQWLSFLDAAKRYKTICKNSNTANDLLVFPEEIIKTLSDLLSTKK